ncbi:type II toxin-antitoxin system VapC family toxin, partial [Lutimaribacter sp. EGI FJ00014]|nr:type II toxin-antitoxin system VapC family toxin [Lutimaribacter sp. EGI FJ00014]
MFIDASAIVAILNKEQGWQEIAKRFQDVQGQCYISPLVRFEASLAVAKAVAGATARAAGDRRRANV